MLTSVKVPKQFEPIFQKAHEYVSKYFKEKLEEPSNGTIEIFGQRYILVRAASMSVDFFETVRKLYKDKGDEEALNVARSLLFDIAHAIGKTDAKNFHKKMKLRDPIEKLSAGPIHFSHSGWAFVDIFPESKPSPDENYYLIYDHPFSFESDAWMKAGKKSDFPVCVMNAGYSSGWCEESFGVTLVASEIMCRAKGDDACRFIMAHPSKIEDYIKEYLKREPELAQKVTKYEIPGFFKRKQMEEELRQAHDLLEIRVQERTAELAQAIETLQTEITERKRAEEILRQSENKYRELIENLPQKIFLKDKNSIYVSCNENYARDLKIKPDEIPGKTDYDFYPRELAEKYCADDQRIMKLGNTEDIEERYIQNEREFWVHTVKTPIKDEKGNCIGLLGIFWDITERKKAEEKLRESEERYRDLFDNASDLIQSADEIGKFVYVNKKWKEVLGYSDEEIKKLNLTDILRKDQVPHCMGLFKKVVSGETLDNVEVVFVTKGGREIFASGFVSPWMKDGKFVATRAIFRDVTEHKRAEENLKKAKEEAEEANRLKSEFLANMSHEIRTPMNAIIGMTGITLDTPLTDEQREYLNIVKESSYSLLGLLDDILDLSKIDAGRVELETIDFDLRATVESVTDTLTSRASDKGIELACLIHHTVPPFLQGDPVRLRQILMNLGGNAVKFTEKGEVVIQVELQEETQDRATLLFSVTDTGISIPQDKQGKIFDSFTQADGSTTRKYGGTGLGLSICRRLVELMGGQIGVESKPGKGSRFWFSVTLQKQKESKETFPIAFSDIQGCRILVVDDNQTNRTILIKMLESFGCSIEAVGSGAEAIQVLKRIVQQENFFDLVLLDMHMPEMDGEETLRVIKDNPEIRDVPVVILTSIGERGDVARLEALGCAGYMTKPIKQSQLFDTIVTVLSQKKADTKEKPMPIVTRYIITEQKYQGVRILVAEDNPMNLKLAVTLLKKAGYSVDAVENGRLAVKALKQASYDLIFMDVQMPEMDGFEATKVIREIEGESKHTPIIAMTAHAMKGDRERCLQAGMDDYISKPIEPKEMFNAVEKWTKYSDGHKVTSLDNKSKSRNLRKFPVTSAANSATRLNSVRTDDNLKEVPLDIKAALLRFDNDKEFFKEMLQEFLDYVPKLLQTIEEAVKRRDAKLVEREAHSLKGAAGNLNAKQIVELALKLELLGRTGDLTGAEEMIENLRAEYKRLDEYAHQSLLVENAVKSLH
jgi:two-component system sensor histidine kinase/response regulator